MGERYPHAPITGATIRPGCSLASTRLASDGDVGRSRRSTAGSPGPPTTVTPQPPSVGPGAHGEHAALGAGLDVALHGVAHERRAAQGLDGGGRARAGSTSISTRRRLPNRACSSAGSRARVQLVRQPCWGRPRAVGRAARSAKPNSSSRARRGVGADQRGDRVERVVDEVLFEPARLDRLGGLVDRCVGGGGISCGGGGALAVTRGRGRHRSPARPSPRRRRHRRVRWRRTVGPGARRDGVVPAGIAASATSPSAAASPPRPAAACRSTTPAGGAGALAPPCAAGAAAPEPVPAAAEPVAVPPPGGRPRGGLPGASSGGSARRAHGMAADPEPACPASAAAAAGRRP